MVDIIPISGCSAPAVTVLTFRLFINHLPLLKNLDVFSPMPLIRGDKTNRTVPMDIVIPLNKLAHPAAGILDFFKSAFRIVRTVFARSKKRFRIGIVIAYPSLVLG